MANSIFFYTYMIVVLFPNIFIKHLLNQTGPALDQLPEELLPALGKFLYIGRDGAEQGEINREAFLYLSSFHFVLEQGGHGTTEGHHQVPHRPLPQHAQHPARCQH